MPPVSRRPLAVVALAMLAVLTGCSQDSAGPQRPGSLRDVDPCQVFSGEDQSELSIRVERPTSTDGHRRTCVFFSTKLLDTAEAGINSLEIVIRDSADPNKITDARRLAAAIKRERSGPLSTRSVNGRDVFQLNGEGRVNGVCSQVFTVNATSSVEVTTFLGENATPCHGADRVADLIDKALPAADNNATPTASDRPETVASLKPCELLAPADRTELGLDAGTPKTPEPACSHNALNPAPQPGSVSSVSVTVVGNGASVREGMDLVTRHQVAGRVVYRMEEPTSGNVGQYCLATFEVSHATSVDIRVMVNGPTAAPACKILDDLEPAIEQRLPAVST